jgi:hypothetical protein
MPTSPSRRRLFDQSQWRLFIEGQNFNRFGTWVASIGGTLALPCLPLMVELLRDEHVKNDSYFLVAAVFSATFIFTARNHFARAYYGLLFLGCLLLDLIPSPTTQTLAHWAGWFLMLVMGAHVIERFFWHVIYDKPFPDTG